MSRSFFLGTEGRLVADSAAFSRMINDDPQRYGLTETQAQHYALVHQEMAAAYKTASEPISRTSYAVGVKNEKKRLLKQAASDLAKIISGCAEVDESTRILLGLSVRKPRTLAERPTEAPSVTRAALDGRRVTIRIRSMIEGRRAMPDGVGCAYVFSFAGEKPPLNMNDWLFNGQTRNGRHVVTFSNAPAPGTPAWITAQWVSRRGEPGPFARPIALTLWGEDLPLPGGLAA